MTASNLRIARERLTKLRAALSAPTPESIEDCLPGLIEAAESLGRVQNDIREHGADEFLFDLHALQRDLRISRQLIERGAAFYRGWAGILAAASAGYTSSGEPRPMEPTGTISIRA
jgi:hypothetical protein